MIAIRLHPSAERTARECRDAFDRDPALFRGGGVATADRLVDAVAMILGLEHQPIRFQEMRVLECSRAFTVDWARRRATGYAVSAAADEPVARFLAGGHGGAFLFAAPARVGAPQRSVAEEAATALREAGFMGASDCGVAILREARLQHVRFVYVRVRAPVGAADTTVEGWQGAWSALSGAAQAAADEVAGGLARADGVTAALVWSSGFDAVVRAGNAWWCYAGCTPNEYACAPAVVRDPATGDLRLFADTALDAGRYAREATAEAQMPVAQDLKGLRLSGTVLAPLDAQAANLTLRAEDGAEMSAAVRQFRETNIAMWALPQPFCQTASANALEYEATVAWTIPALNKPAVDLICECMAWMAPTMPTFEGVDEVVAFYRRTKATHVLVRCADQRLAVAVMQRVVERGGEIRFAEMAEHASTAGVLAFPLAAFDDSK